MLTGSGPHPVRIATESSEGAWVWSIDSLLRIVLRPWSSEARGANSSDVNTTAESGSSESTSDSGDDDDPDKWCLTRYTAEQFEESDDIIASNDTNDSEEDSSNNSTAAATITTAATTTKAANSSSSTYSFTTSSVVLTRCDSKTYRQKWITLPRGPNDPNANLWDVNFPLRRSGRRLFDASGRVVRLRGVNWYGAHTESGVNNGLDKLPIANITRLIRHLGFNHVRMNYAVEMWVNRNKNVTAQSFLLTANPELIGKTEFEVFDTLVKAITAEGLMVIINAHTSDKRWCCSITDDQGLWYNDRWSEEDWLDSLQGLAARYADDPRVIGYDIRNEPRPDETSLSWIWWNTHVWGNCTDVSLYSIGEPLLKFGSFSKQGICLPKWSADWRSGAEQGAYAVWHGAPDAIVFVEGLGAAQLLDVKSSPMRFVQDCLSSRIVWSIHEYTWTWRFLRLFEIMTTGASSNGESLQDLFETLANIYRDEDPDRNDWDTFVRDRNSSYAFFLEENSGSVWIGEFGENGRSDWWLAFMKYAKEMDLDWSYWSIDGYKYAPGVEVDPSYMASNQKFDLPGGIVQDYVPEPYGILEPDYKAVHHPWKLADLVQLQGPVVSDDITVDPRTWKTCTFDGAAQPVVGTGEKPTMFDDFLTKPDECTEGTQGKRRLSEDMLTGDFNDSTTEEEDATAEEDTPLSTTEALTAIARQRQEAACSANPSMYAELTSEERASARDIIEANQVGGRDGENPVDDALRSSTPAETARKIRAIAEEEASSARSFGWSLVIGLPSTLFLVCCAARLGRDCRSRNSRWKTPQAVLCTPLRLLRRCCCKGPEQIVPPLKSKIAQATASVRKWQPLFLILWIGLTLGMISAGTWALRGSMLVNRGMGRFRCATLRGLDETLNGVSESGEGTWAGLLPALAHLQNLTSTLSENTGDWNLVQHLIEETSVLPTELAALHSVLEGVSETFDESCPLVTHDALLDASHHVEWSFGHVLELAYGQLKSLKSKWDGAVKEVKNQLVATSNSLARARDFITGHFLYFYENDPTGWASQAVQQGSLGLLILFFLVMVPMLLLSSAAMAHIICCNSGPSMLGARSEAEEEGSSNSGEGGGIDEEGQQARPSRFGNQLLQPSASSSSSSAAAANAAWTPAPASAIAEETEPQHSSLQDSKPEKSQKSHHPRLNAHEIFGESVGGSTLQVLSLDDVDPELPPPKPPNERQPQQEREQEERQFEEKQKKLLQPDFDGVLPASHTATFPSLLPVAQHSAASASASAASPPQPQSQETQSTSSKQSPSSASMPSEQRPSVTLPLPLSQDQPPMLPGRRRSASLPLPPVSEPSGWTFHDSPMSKRLNKKRCKCCRLGPFSCCGYRFGRERSARDAFIRSIAASPTAALTMWVTGLFFSLITLATSAWLRSAVAPFASACVVLDHLTSDSLLTYSQAVGLPLGKSSVVGVAATGIIAECLTQSDSGGLDEMFEIETCPADALPGDINGTLKVVEKWGRKRLDSLLHVKAQTRLETDSALLEFERQLQGGLQDGSSCEISVNKSEVLLEILEGACNSTKACAFSSWGEPVDAEELGNLTAAVFSDLALRVDHTVDRSVNVLVHDVVVAGVEDILYHFEEISAMLDCSFLRSIWDLTKDSLCYEVVVGLIHLRDTLFVLGLLCLMMSVVMYFLWIRLIKHRAVVRDHWDSRKRSESCGRPLNLSILSKRLALGELLDFGRPTTAPAEDPPQMSSKDDPNTDEHASECEREEEEEEASPGEADWLETGRLRL